MKQRNLRLAFVLLLTAGGCSQIIGLGDYDIDPKLDGPTKAGSRNNEGGEGGDPSQGGTSNGGKAGSSPQPVGGEGGTKPIVNPGAGEAGQPPSDGGAGGGAPGPVLIPCDSVNCCTTKGGRTVGEELLVIPVPSDCDTLTDYCEPGYGGFEYGTKAEGNSPWAESSQQDYPLVTDGVEEGSTPYKGTYLAFLGGVHDESSLLISQPIDIPSDAGWLTLSGYRLFEADRADPTVADNEDTMSLSLWDATDPLEVPFYWDNTNPGIATDWTKFEATFDATPHQGTTRYLYALGETDDWSDADGAGGAGSGAGFPGGSNYMLDELSLKVFRCYER
jgi:hypothetical protein